jgi:hypothetical protein
MMEPSGPPTSATRAAIRRATYVFAIAVTLAYLEVQIEGPNGWAAALPTWRTLDPRITWLFGGRPVTGYHVSLVTFILLMFHWPVMFKPWSLLDEIRVLHPCAVLAIVWDFLWFVLNPAFGMRRYGPGQIWWFPRWTLGIPTDYWIGIAIGLALWILPVVRRKLPREQAVKEALIGLGIPVGGAVCLVLIHLATRS